MCVFSQNLNDVLTEPMKMGLTYEYTLLHSQLHPIIITELLNGSPQPFHMHETEL
jgi:hypothetical protein